MYSCQNMHQRKYIKASFETNFCKENNYPNKSELRVNIEDIQLYLDVHLLLYFKL